MAFSTPPDMMKIIHNTSSWVPYTNKVPQHQNALAWVMHSIPCTIITTPHSPHTTSPPHPISSALISRLFPSMLSASLTETQLYNNLLSCIIIFSAFVPKQLHSPHSQNNHHQYHTCTHVYDILDPCTRLHILTRDCYYDANESWRCHEEAPNE